MTIKSKLTPKQTQVIKDITAQFNALNTRSTANLGYNFVNVQGMVDYKVAEMREERLEQEQFNINLIAFKDSYSEQLDAIGMDFEACFIGFEIINNGQHLNLVIIDDEHNSHKIVEITAYKDGAEVSPYFYSNSTNYDSLEELITSDRTQDHIRRIVRKITASRF